MYLWHLVQRALDTAKCTRLDSVLYAISGTFGTIINMNTWHISVMTHDQINGGLWSKAVCKSGRTQAFHATVCDGRTHLAV